MANEQNIRVHFSEEHAGLGPAYLEVRFPENEAVSEYVLASVESHFCMAVRAEGIKAQPLVQKQVGNQTVLSMELPQFNGWPRSAYLRDLDSCATQVERKLAGIIAQLNEPAKQTPKAPQKLNVRYDFSGENVFTGAKPHLTIYFCDAGIPEGYVDEVVGIVKQAKRDLFGPNANNTKYFTSSFDSGCAEAPHGALVSVGFDELPDDGTNGSRTMRKLAAKVAVAVRALEI